MLRPIYCLKEKRLQRKANFEERARFARPLNTWCIFRGGSAQSVSFLFQIQGVRLAQERAWSEFRTPLAGQPLRTSGLQADPWIHHLGAALRNRERSAVLRSVRLRNRTDSRRTPSAERHTGRGTQASAASPASDVPSSAEARGTRVRRAAANQHFPKEILRKVLIRLVRTSGLNRRLIDSSRSLTVKET